MTKTKEIFCTYDEEKKVATVTIENKYGIFTGHAALHTADSAYESSLAGKRIAYAKAFAKYYIHRANLIMNEVNIIDEVLLNLQNKHEINKYVEESIRKQMNAKLNQASEWYGKANRIIANALHTEELRRETLDKMHELMQKDKEKKLNIEKLQKLFEKATLDKSV